MYLHPTYVVTPEREPSASPMPADVGAEEKASDGTRPGMRESLRWSEGYERIAETALTMPGTWLLTFMWPTGKPIRSN